MSQVKTDNVGIYNDIKIRTNGEIYIGIVGPVRTGKSTFIKRFMDLLVIPNMEDEHARRRTSDELPQSSAGKTIMTTEPKFVPKDAAKIKLDDDAQVAVRLIDCVGYMVNGATGHIENDNERMVKTPWFDYEIPFTKAAEIGTKKVINDHSTIGLVVTCDGSFSDLNRDDYIEAEEKTINELKNIGKPFIVLLNSNKPYSEETLKIANDIENKHQVRVMPVNCEQLKKEDILNIINNILFEFPLSEVTFNVPKWIEILETGHWLKDFIVKIAKNIIKDARVMKDINDYSVAVDEYNNEKNVFESIKIKNKNLSNGSIELGVNMLDSLYYNILSELTGESIENEYELVHTIKYLSTMKNEFENVKDAIKEVKNSGYGVVLPVKEEIILEEPEVIRNGNKFGVKIKAQAPSIHMIKTNVLTEIAPIVGSEEQANDLISFIKQNETSEEGIWNANIFGKSIEQIVNDGIKTKIDKMSVETQGKMQETLQKITNDSKGGVICIII
ncbi:MAG: stage IV sporulation protein A [Lachnospiraceae bacterium]|nr:stage IV sporulation protein A [Lachnospiraceae bacterium]